MKKVWIASILATLIIIVSLSTVNANDTNEDEEEPIRERFLIFGFYPSTYRNWYFYYIIPGILWRGVPEYALIWHEIYYLPGPYIIIGISNELPIIGIGKKPN